MLPLPSAWLPAAWLPAAWLPSARLPSARLPSARLPSARLPACLPAWLPLASCSCLLPACSLLLQAAWLPSARLLPASDLLHGCLLLPALCRAALPSCLAARLPPALCLAARCLASCLRPPAWLSPAAWLPGCLLPGCRHPVCFISLAAERIYTSLFAIFWMCPKCMNFLRLLTNRYLGHVSRSRKKTQKHFQNLQIARKYIFSTKFCIHFSGNPPNVSLGAIFAVSKTFEKMMKSRVLTCSDDHS